MAITIATAADTYSATGMPVVFVVTSDRDGALSTTVTLTDYSGTVAGTIKGTTSGAHGLLTGDIVTISNTDYDDTYSVTKIDATSFYFTAIWAAGDASGNVVKDNDNFQIKAVVRSWPASATLATIRKIAVSGNYTFDISDILEAQLTGEPLTLGGTASVVDANATYFYDVVFTEEFDDENGLLKTADTITSSTGIAVLGTTQYNEDQDTDDYLSDSSTPGKFLTTSPSLYIHSDEEVQLSLLVSTNVTSANLYLFLTDSSGNTSSQTVTAVTVSGTGAQIVRFPVNTGKFGASVQVDCTAKDQANATISETKTIYVDSLCDNGIRLWWMNPLGGWDAYTFKGEPEKSVSTKRSEYSVNNSTKKNYIRKVSDVDGWEEYRLESDWLRASEGAWLATLLRSKDVRMQESDGTLRKIVLANTSDRIAGHDMVKIIAEFTVSEGLK